MITFVGNGYGDLSSNPGRRRWDSLIHINTNKIQGLFMKSDLVKIRFNKVINTNDNYIDSLASISNINKLEVYEMNYTGDLFIE